MNTDKPMKLVDGKLEPLTDAETKQRELDEAEWAKDNPPEPKDEPDAKRRSKR
jgi:hypothetical protein